MTILGNWQRREGRKHIFKARSPSASHKKRNSNSNSNSNGNSNGNSSNNSHGKNTGGGRPKSAIELFISQKKKGSSPMDPIQVSDDVMRILQVEVSDLVGVQSHPKTVTVAAMANALIASRRLMDRHANNNSSSSSSRSALAKVTRTLQSLAFGRRRSKMDEDALRRRYELMNALNRMEKLSDSTTRTVSSWQEALPILAEIFQFPKRGGDDDDDDHDHDHNYNYNSEKAEPNDEDEISKKHAQRLDDCFRKEEMENLVPLTDKWKQVAAVPRPRKLGEDGQGQDDDLDAHRTAWEKADKLFTIRLAGATSDLEALSKSKAVQEVEEQLLEKERQEEARKRASALMRPLTDKEQAIVNEAMYGIGPGGDVLAREGSDFVQRSSMQTLQPSQWLNDEVIHHFLLMLAKRDEELCQQESSRKRCHFFKSFFITKLLNEGNANPNIEGTYEYRNVKRWSKKVPGKDLFKLDKVIFPINVNCMHWICAVAYITEKRIQMYDSMGSNGMHYLESIFQYLQDDHKDKKGTPLADLDQWQLVPTTGDTPRQRNGHDCGVFSCMAADFLSKGCPLVYSQDHITQCRERIVLSIMNGKAIM